MADDNSVERGFSHILKNLDKAMHLIDDVAYIEKDGMNDEEYDVADRVQNILLDVMDTMQDAIDVIEGLDDDDDAE